MNGSLQSRTRQSGKVATYSYTGFGQVQGIVYTDSGGAYTPPVSHTYDPFSGKLLTTSDAAGKHTFTYAADGQPEQESISNAGGSYDLLVGAALNYTYDGQNRRKWFAASFAGSTVPATGYYYSDLGRLSRVTAANRRVQYAYVPGSTLVERRDAMVGVGANATRVLASTQVYDERGHLKDVVHTRDAFPGAATLAHHYSVDTLGRRTTAEREDGTRWDYGYDVRSQVTSGVKSNNGAPLPGAQQTYSYDQVGNRLTSQEGGNASGLNRRTVNYTPNALNQYSNITRGEANTLTKTDFLGTAGSSADVTVNSMPAERAGPWWRAEVPAAFANATFASADIRLNGYNIDGALSGEEVPRLAPTYPAVIPMSYDADGNLQYDGRNYYIWDAENRLSLVSAPGPGGSQVQLNLFYDAQGRRICKMVGKYADSQWFNLFVDYYLYDGWNLAATYRIPGNGSTPLLHQSYVWGLDVSGTLQGAGGVGGLLMTVTPQLVSHQNSWESFLTWTTVWQAHFPTYDGNGNVMALVRANAGTTGVVDASYEYDPFGRTLRATGSQALTNPFRFSTKFTDDETGLVYYGYRYYDAALGRWISRDPIGEEGGKNVYGLTIQNFVDFTDRNGQYFIWAHVPGGVDNPFDKEFHQKAPETVNRSTKNVQTFVTQRAAKGWKSFKMSNSFYHDGIGLMLEVIDDLKEEDVAWLVKYEAQNKFQEFDKVVTLSALREVLNDLLFVKKSANPTPTINKAGALHFILTVHGTPDEKVCMNTAYFPFEEFNKVVAPFERSGIKIAVCYRQDGSRKQVSYENFHFDGFGMTAKLTPAKVTSEAVK